MRDGARLAARVWRPVTDEPLPAVFEYIPYRKRDLTRERDSLNHPYLAGHGYVSVRVDMRGSGDSDGVLFDEYLESEHDDACQVIDWLAEQPWCDGNVGMMGISWGGFNSLQVAAHRPQALKAIISASATEDLYVDNMHYMGGCVLADNLSDAARPAAGQHLPAALLRGPARPLGRRTVLALAIRDPARVHPHPVRIGREVSRPDAAACRQGAVAAERRHVRREVGLLRRHPGPALRSARGGRRLTGLRDRGTGRGLRDPRPADPRPDRLRRPPAGDG